MPISVDGCRKPHAYCGRQPGQVQDRESRTRPGPPRYTDRWHRKRCPCMSCAVSARGQTARLVT